MEWGMLLAIVGLATLLQLAFFWYYIRLGRRNDSVYPSLTGNSSDNATQQASNTRSQPQRQAHDEKSTFKCDTCGFENEWDSVYTFCGRCVSKLQ